MPSSARIASSGLAGLPRAKRLTPSLWLATRMGVNCWPRVRFVTVTSYRRPSCAEATLDRSVTTQEASASPKADFRADPYSAYAELRDLFERLRHASDVKLLSRDMRVPATPINKSSRGKVPNHRLFLGIGSRRPAL